MKFAELFARKELLEPAQQAPVVIPDLFWLRTGVGHWLAVQGDQPGLVTQESRSKQTAILALVPPGAPQNSLLIAPDGRHITIENDGFVGPAISFRLKRVSDGRVELRHPLAPARYLGIVPGRANRVLFDRVGDETLDRFELHPAGAEALGMFGRVLAKEIALTLSAPLGADGLMALLHAGTVRVELAEALIRLLPADEISVLASRVMARPEDAALLRRAMPEDPWVGDVLRHLQAWLVAGRPSTRRALSPAADRHVSMLQSGDLRPQAGLALQSMVRRAVPPRRRACVLATARNEGAYLLDWLAHHRAAGFDHAIIYSNDNDDGSDTLLGLLADHGEITWVRNELAPEDRAQWKAYGHAFKVLPDILDYRWTMVLDLDEYFGLAPDRFANVADFLGWQEYQQTDAVALRWQVFVADELDVWHDKPSTKRFLNREAEPSPLFKSVVRSALFWDAHCHFPYPTMELPHSYRLENGAACTRQALFDAQCPVTANEAWVAHHILRSAGEALMKVTRGDAMWNASDRAEPGRLDTIVRRFVALVDAPGLIADNRTLRTAPGLEAELARLRGLSGVRACDAEVKHMFRARLGAVSQAFLDAPVAEGRPAEYLRFQQILQGQAGQWRASAA